MPTVPRPLLTPRRRELLDRFVKKFTPEEQAAIRSRAEARGIDYLEMLLKNGDLSTPKGNR